jgi:proline dehydrogenase
LLRRALLAAADNDRLRRLAMDAPIARGVAHRFVAGETLEEAMDVVAAHNRRGIAVTLDHLGEAVDDPTASREAADTYVASLEAIGARGADASVSVKASQFGLGRDPDTCRAMVGEIATAAKEAGTHVTIDMEDSSLTQATVDLVLALREDGHEHVGCAVQAYLHRTPADVELLVSSGASLRLCKGAYDEDPAIAHQGAEAIRAAYVEVAGIMLDAQQAGGGRPRFATHDHMLLHRVRAEMARRGVGEDQVEVQTLYGVRPDWEGELVRRGLDVRVYVPFGTRWYPYLVRRLAERPANLQFFLRALVSGGRPS